ncbi:MAG: tetratricopeptide repeat protein [Deltaproteobacteria bacterium]|nr:tetratricopeptide repeat protein [Deltaproteobacteria bacterium]MBK8235393.1 tetratricopeptide repeat protein [Deltaproteobacteria bacterium]MBK8716287.1 tetratricopeptide repeat protein [Deltaproteobacteria bacterium]MBP7291283.1 tetratricopeptide repeat protein [Nannocystaceae bacterium]
MRIRLGAPFVLALALPLLPTGCLALKADQDEIAREVAKLRKEVAQSQETLQRASSLSDELEKKLAQVEEVLRSNQAGLGARVDVLETDTQDLRGRVENAENVASAVQSELKEVRSDLDARLKQLEEKLNEATNIPEGKSELYAEADRQMKAKKYKNARRLWRTYESRYPEDSKLAEVKFFIGLTYFSERDYKAALGEFYNVIQQSPDSSVIPDALYYSGLAFAKLGQCTNAIAYFDALRQKKTKAPEDYKKKAGEQIDLLKKDTGEICLDKDKAPAKPS